MEDAGKAQLLGALLQRGTAIGYNDEVFGDLIHSSHCADAIEEIFHEDVGFQRTAGFGGDDEQRLAEIDRPCDRLDLCRIGAVQYVEARPARLSPESLTQDFRTQARPAHPEQYD